MVNTLADFPPDRFDTIAFCNDCDHQGRVPPETLPPDMPMDAFDIQLRCSECGSRNAQVRIV